MSLDFITNLPKSQGAMTVLVGMLTKMAHFVPCTDIPAAWETAQLFMCHIFRVHGFPDRIESE